MPLKLKIILNPSSGREQARVNIEDTLADLLPEKAIERADIFYTRQKGDAVRYASETPAGVYDFMIAVGGDGTVNEVVTGMMRSGIDLPLAIYTSGTVNDFAVINDLPSTPSAFAKMLLDPAFKKVDCGKVNDKYFMNVLAGGLLTDISYKVPSELKTTFGPAAYWITAMKDLRNVKPTIPLLIKANGKEYSADSLMFLISNTKSVGGFRKLMTRADLTDGLLDVLIVKKMDNADVIPLLGNLMVGDHLNNDNVIYFQTDAMEITVREDCDVILDIDGEKGPSLPVSVSCIKDAITMVVPFKEDRK